MSDVPPDEGPLADSHNVARYCGKQAIGESDCLPKTAAFRVREGENYLSVNWLEYFHECDFDIALIGIRCALTRKGLTIGAESKFATLNVGIVKNTLSQIREQMPQIIRKAEDLDESHAGIYVRQEKAMIVAYMLAKLVRRGDMYSGKGYE